MASARPKSAYKYQGKFDVNKDGTEEVIYTNKVSGSWVTALNTPKGEMFRLYNSAFELFTDSDGLKYWIDVYSSGINKIKVVAASFVRSAELKRCY